MPLIPYSDRLPITTSFALPLTTYYIFLQGRVVYHRFSSQTPIGQDSIAPAERNVRRPDRLLAAVRAQTNFSENVPLALILAGLVERDGGSKRLLSWVLGTLCGLRLLHAEGGIMSEGYTGKGRPIGFMGTVAVNAGLAVWAAWGMIDYWMQLDNTGRPMGWGY